MKPGFGKIENIFRQAGMSIYTPRQFVVTLIDPDGVDSQILRCTWIPDTRYETEIYVSVDEGAFSLLTTVGLNVGIYDYEQIGGVEHTYSFYARFKDNQTILNAPIGISAVFISNGVRIVWDDNNTEADHVEIWANIANAGYVLLTTLENGVETYDHITTESIIKYKFRAKEDTLPVYSDFSNEIILTEPSYDSDAVAFFAQIVTDGGTIGVGKKVAYNNYILAQKASGVWTKIFAEWWTMDGTIKGRINIKSPAVHKITNGTVTYIDWIQSHGVGSNLNFQNGWLELNWNAVTEGIDKNSFAVHWYGEANKSGSGSLYGGTSNFRIPTYYIMIDSTGHSYTGINTGHCSVERVNSRVDFYNGATSVDNYTSPAGTVQNESLRLLSRVGSTAMCNERIAYFAFTSALSVSERAANLSAKETLRLII